MRRRTYAFPCGEQFDGRGCHTADHEPGLTIMEEIATRLLQGILANPAVSKVAENGEDYDAELKRRAQLAVDQARMLLEELR